MGVWLGRGTQTKEIDSGCIHLSLEFCETLGSLVKLWPQNIFKSRIKEGPGPRGTENT